MKAAVRLGLNRFQKKMSQTGLGQNRFGSKPVSVKTGFGRNRFWSKPVWDIFLLKPVLVKTGLVTFLINIFFKKTIWSIISAQLFLFVNPRPVAAGTFFFH